MRIAFVTETWKPSINGVVTRLSASIDELVTAGHEILVIAPSLGAGDAAASRQPGVTVRRVPSFRVSWVYGGQPWGWPLPRVRRMLADFSPDLVHVAGPFVLGLAGVLGARSLKLPLVVSFHTDIAAYSASYHLGWSRPIIWRILRGLHNAGQLNLVTSEHSARLLADHGITNVALWRRGVDLDRFQPIAPRDRPRAAPPTALYVGRLADEKCVDSLLPLARSGQVRLVLVGDGPDRRRLEQEFAGTDTVFRGSLDGTDLPAVYAEADVFVFTSTTETLGLVLIEALASGLPVAAVESPASCELLGGLEIAKLIPPQHPEGFAPAIAELLTAHAPATRAALARREAAPWGWAEATHELLDHYQKVLEAAAMKPAVVLMQR
jgi:glycosyltransferase involved in cell wall biosynthesis